LVVRRLLFPVLLAANVAACEVHEPHDFTGQESEIAAGIARFMRGGSY
jgi:hypothetical protein